MFGPQAKKVDYHTDEFESKQSSTKWHDAIGRPELSTEGTFFL